MIGDQDSNSILQFRERPLNVSLISPLCSQDHIELYKKYEQKQILASFYQVLSHEGRDFETSGQHWHQHGDELHRNIESSQHGDREIGCRELEADERIHISDQKPPTSFLKSPAQYQPAISMQECPSLQSLLHKAHSTPAGNSFFPGTQSQQQQAHKKYAIHQTNSTDSQSASKQCTFISKGPKSPLALTTPSTEQLKKGIDKDLQLPFQASQSANSKTFHHNQIYNSFKTFTGETLLSAHNTPLRTPARNDHLFFYTEQKQQQQKIQKNLFSTGQKPHQQASHETGLRQLTQTNQQADLSIKREPNFSKSLFFNQGSELSLTSKLNQSIMSFSSGQKRQGDPIVKLEQEIVKDQTHTMKHLMNTALPDQMYVTPNKRLRHDASQSDPKFEEFKEALLPRNLKQEKFSPPGGGSDAEDSDGHDDSNNLLGDMEDKSAANRKKRGLKILSVKVQELVQKKQSTTYKDVANELIKQLRENRKSKEDLAGLGAGDEDSDMDDDYLSDESPQKQSKAGGGDQGSSSQQKWEKNVRRRVYDALNVLYAAGVLKKEGKHVSCDSKALLLTNKLKEGSRSASSVQSSAQKQPHVYSAHDQKLLQQIEQMKQQLNVQKQRCDDKRELLCEQFKNYVSYKHLIERNKEELGSKEEVRHCVSLPFILVSTKDSPDNEVDITFGEQNRALNISMKAPMKCIGDADTLVRLKMYKVSRDWLLGYVPDSDRVLNLLNEKQLNEILI